MRWAIAAASVVVAAGLCALLVATGVLWPNRFFAAGYSVRGVDVSVYQGDIDWDTLADQDIDFAFIKATEGSGSQDSRFAENWQAARQTDLLVGAYHFLSFDSSGSTQADNIIATVPNETGALPVVVDVECYADYCATMPTKQQVRDILDPLLADLEAHYGAPPILYATADYYDSYLRDGYGENPIWIRSVFTPPTLPDGRAWDLWQYSNREKLPGYEGDEDYIDLNVFRGTLDELKSLRASGQR